MKPWLWRGEKLRRISDARPGRIVIRFWKGVFPIPKIQREAVLLLSTAELSKALGIPFDQVQQVDWWQDEDSSKLGLRLRVRTEEEIEVKGHKRVESGNAEAV